MVRGVGGEGCSKVEWDRLRDRVNGVGAIIR
jgi:hypothetical protein